MEKEKYKRKLLELLKTKFGIRDQYLSAERMEISLLDKTWQISSIELVYLILEIESVFGISIPADYLKENYQLNIKGLLEEIYELVESN